jgi:hypothetical protein
VLAEADYAAGERESLMLIDLAFGFTECLV